MSDNTRNKQNMSESEFMKHFKKGLKIINKETVSGIGDDAAVLENADKQIVVATNLLVEGIHFDLAYVPLKHLGYKAAVINFSDIYAMNAMPKQILVSIAVSNRFATKDIELFYEGLKLACANYGVDLVGGGISSSVRGLFVSTTVVGNSSPEHIVYRKNAKVNDLICVSGNLGAAYMGLQLLKRENKLFQADPNMQPELSSYDYILQRQLMPEARKDVVAFLKSEQIIPSSMIDVSDGLSSGIVHVCDDSDLGCKIFEDKIPIADETAKMANELNIDSLVCALDGGEDYELLFTVEQKEYEKLKSTEDISIIGHISNKSAGKSLVTREGAMIPLQAKGWDSFVNKDAN